MTKTFPVVGITTYAVHAEWRDWQAPSILTPRTYVDRITRAGGLAVLIPPQTHALGAIEQVVSGLDALVLVGGEDMCGSWSNRPETAEAHEYHNVERDSFEVAVASAAWDADLPVLAICRGLQVLNVSRGGSLIEDLPAAGAANIHRVVRGVFHPHAVSYASDATPGLFDPEANVPSHHHQAVDRVGEGLRVVGRAEDKVIEAVEGSGKSFVVGVQWHPEEGTDDRLFDALVEAARGRAAA